MRILLKSVAGSDIYPQMNKAVSVMEQDETNGISPERIARKLHHIAQKSSPSSFYTEGWQYHLFVLLNKILPASLIYYIVGKMYS